MHADRGNNIQVRAFSALFIQISFIYIHRLRLNGKDLLLYVKVYVLLSLCICVNICRYACATYVTVLCTLISYRRNSNLKFSAMLTTQLLLN
jgi:hypothetical protein